MTIEKIHSHGNTIEIDYDHYPENPRDELDNLTTFAFFHRNYKNESDIRTEDFSSLNEIQRHIEKTLDAICLPVYLYSHSGDTISTKPFSCPWDSGQLGFVYVTREKAREWFGWKAISPKRLEHVKKTILSDIETFNSFINGQVYQYTIKDSEGTIIDSCHGFYDKEYAISEAIQNCKNIEMVA